MLGIALPAGEPSERCERRSPDGALGPRARECVGEPPSSLGKMRVRKPEPAQGPGQLELGIRVVSAEPLERGPKIVVVGFEALRALGFRVHAMRIHSAARDRNASAWRRRSSSASPEASSCSAAYSRIVSSIRKRSSATGFSRLRSTSADKASRSASQTSSEAPSGKLPRKTERRAKRRLASSSRRSWLHSIVALRVR